MAYYIGGDRQLPNGRDGIAVVNAATEEALGSIAAVNANDARRAVRAAREAFAWSATSLAERVGYLKKAAEWTKSIQLPQDFASRLTSETS